MITRFEPETRLLLVQSFVLLGKSGIRTHDINYFLYKDLADLRYKPLSHFSVLFYFEYLRYWSHKDLNCVLQYVTLTTKSSKGVVPKESPLLIILKKEGYNAYRCQLDGSKSRYVGVPNIVI
jgi:hypothetical protein